MARSPARALLLCRDRLSPALVPLMSWDVSAVSPRQDRRVRLSVLWHRLTPPQARSMVLKFRSFSLGTSYRFPVTPLWSAQLVTRFRRLLVWVALLLRRVRASRTPRPVRAPLHLVTLLVQWAH